MVERIDNYVSTVKKMPLLGAKSEGTQELVT